MRLLRYCYGECSGVSFIDPTPLAVCHNRRIARHRMFKDGCPTRQELGRLVLWFQAASGGQ